MSVVPKPPAFVYWLVRGRAPNGVLLEFVELWGEMPKRVAHEQGFYWMSRGPVALDGYLESLWPMEAWQKLGVIPDTDLECIRIERREPIVITPRPKAV